MIQLVLFGSLWASELAAMELEFKYELWLEMFCRFLTNLVLHYGFIPIIRNGVMMCRFVVYHQEEFEHPYVIFSLGVMIQLVNMFCCLTNLYNSIFFKTVLDVVGKYVSFLIGIQVQDFYNKANRNMPGMGAIAKNAVKIHLDRTKVRNKGFFLIEAFLRNAIFSVYYYFFPFVIIIFPVYNLAKMGRISELV